MDDLVVDNKNFSLIYIFNFVEGTIHENDGYTMGIHAHWTKISQFKYGYCNKNRQTRILAYFIAQWEWVDRKISPYATYSKSSYMGLIMLSEQSVNWWISVTDIELWSSSGYKLWSEYRVS